VAVDNAGIVDPGPIGRDDQLARILSVLAKQRNLRKKSARIEAAA
jgi:hypothetical protein